MEKNDRLHKKLIKLEVIKLRLIMNKHFIFVFMIALLYFCNLSRCQGLTLNEDYFTGFDRVIFKITNKTDFNNKDNDLTFMLGPPIEQLSNNQAFPPIHNHNLSDSHVELPPLKFQEEKNGSNLEIIEIGSIFNSSKANENASFQNNELEIDGFKHPLLIENKSGISNMSKADPGYTFHYVTLPTNVTISKDNPSNATNLSSISGTSKTSLDELTTLPDHLIQINLNKNTNQTSGRKAIGKIDHTKNSLASSNETMHTITKEINLNKLVSEADVSSTEYPTEMHGVKLSKGHLHFNNKTYNYNDPGREVEPSSKTLNLNDFILPAAFLIGCLILIIFISYITVKVYQALFGNPNYSEFDNERNSSMSNVHRYYTDEDKQEEFRKKELKGELEPAIFYKHQQDLKNTNNSTSKRQIQGLNLEFDSSDKDSEKQNRDIQEQIKKLHYDMSSRSSREFDKMDDPRMKGYQSKDNSQNGI